jgi:hypothetical protein
MRPWHLQGGDAMMHMLVAPDGGGGELQPFAAPLAEQELELHRDNADDGLEGHVRYVRASKSFPFLCWLQVVRVSRRWCVEEGLASPPWLLAVTVLFLHFRNLFYCFSCLRNGYG